MISSKLLKIYFFAAFFLIAVDLSGQRKSIRFHHYTMENGLPQNFIDCIIQDSKGFVWIGTWTGLARFDGYDFKVFRQNQNDNKTVSNNYVYSICEGQDGNLYLATNDGLNTYHYSTNTFVHYSDYPEKYPMLSESLSAVAAGKDYTIWVAGGSGLTGFNINDSGEVSDLRTYSFGEEDYQVHGTYINHLMIDNTGQVWVSTDNGISVLDPLKESFNYLNASVPYTIPYNSVKSTYEAKDGHIWIATEFGIADFNPGDSVFTIYNYDEYERDNNSLVHPYSMSIVEDARGNILVGTFGGLSIIKEENGKVKFENYKENTLSDYSLNNEFINCLMRDRDGNIWIGTERGGINRYNSSKNVFEYFEHEPDNINSISNNVINTIYEDEYNIWVGTAGGGLNVIDKRTNEIRKYFFIFNNNTGKSINDFISASHRDNTGKLWFGTWGGGLFRVINENTPNEKFVNYLPSIDTNSLVNVYVSSLTSDAKGNLWIGTYNGLDYFDREHNIFRHIKINNGKDNILQVGSLLFDSKENLWVGTRNGLYKIEFDDNEEYTVNKYIHNPDNRSSLSDNYVTTLFMDSKGDLWVGIYGFGINKLVSEENEGEFMRLSIEDGLPNNNVYRILEDNNGYLWITTDYGLARYNPQAKKFKNFFISDGLQNNQYYWNAAFMNDKGKLYIGGVNGMNAFYPDSILYDSLNLHGKVTISDFKIYNQSVNPGEEFYGSIILNQPILMTDELEVSYKAKQLSFEFTSLNYHQAKTIQYAYMLEGFDSKWNEITSNRRFASYTNLKPHKYVFKVKSTLPSGEWSNEVTSVILTITPPFWDTWLFRITVLVMLLVMVVGYNRYKVYSLRKRQIELERQVVERTAEIENQKEKLQFQNEHIHKQRDNLVEMNKKVKAVNESKLKFFTNISHEFRTPLTLILGPLETLIQDNSLGYKVKQSIDQININAQRLLTLINQLMDFRKLEHGKMKLHVYHSSFNKFMEHVVKAFRPLAEMKRINFTHKALTDEGETWMDVQKLENVMYNLLSNAFKYTPVGGEIVIATEWMDKEKGIVSIEIRDNGSGISADKLENIFDRFYQVESLKDEHKGTGIGLSLAKEIIEVHKGKIKVNSNINAGTVFILELPLYKMSYHEEEISEDGLSLPNLTNQVKVLQNELSSKLKHAKPGFGTNFSLGETKKLLIVEDNIELREFLVEKLKDEFAILQAENGEQGFQIAQAENPDVILSDIMMPVMDGLMLCQKTKTTLATSHIPVLLLTAKSEVQDQITGLQTGADAYISKPFNMALLRANIINLIENRLNLFKAFNLQQNIDVDILATTPTDEEFLEKVLQIIKGNFDNTEFNVSVLAKELTMSRGHLHRKLTGLSGMSPVDFINNIKLKRAVELLKSSKYTISEIGYAVGYNDPKYFSRIFKKQYGKTPKAFQETEK